MDRLIRDKLLDHMNETNFLPHSSMDLCQRNLVFITQLLETLDEITDAIEQGYDVDIIFLAFFCKAFDKIPHKRLLKKL